MATLIHGVDKTLGSGATLRIESNPNGFWLLSIVGGAQVPVTQNEAYNFQANLPRFYDQCMDAINTNLTGASLGISIPLAAGITLSIANDPALSGFWNLSFLQNGAVIGSVIAITQKEALILKSDVIRIYGLTLSK